MATLLVESPAARKALFNPTGFPGLEQKITPTRRMAANRREGSKVFANPSGTDLSAGPLANTRVACSSAVSGAGLGHCFPSMDDDDGALPSFLRSPA
jgi:hypothetical protein